MLGPTIQVPANLKLYSSDFLSDPEGTLAHTQSDWQITLKSDTAYSSPVSQSLNDSTDLTVWEPSNLEEGTAYRCRVRHKSNNVVSEWSDDSTFKTADEASNDLVVTPGDVWSLGKDIGAGALRTNPVKMISVAWGNTAIGLGADGKVYTGSDLTYGGMTELFTPAVDYKSIGQSYGPVAIGMRTDNRVDYFNTSTGISIASGLSLPGNIAISTFSVSKTGTMFYFLGSDKKIYRADNNASGANVPSSIDLWWEGFPVKGLAVSKTYRHLTSSLLMKMMSCINTTSPT